MTVITYKMGFKHGKEGKPKFCQRKGKRYVDERNNRSYYNGYSDGVKQRQS